MSKLILISVIIAAIAIPARAAREENPRKGLRKAIIQTLFDRGFIERRRRQVVSTPIGRALIEILPELATRPDMTALWEATLRKVQDRQVPLEGFLNAVQSKLAELVNSRADIDSSDQGQSFQAFYDFLLSETRQDELAHMLARLQSLEQIETDRRLRTVHHDWSEAAERTQRTVRQISEQLRRFLDDQVWLENRRVLDLVRSIEATALSFRDTPPAIGLEVYEPGVRIALPILRRT